MDGIQKASEGRSNRPGFRRDKLRLRIETIGKTGRLLFVASFLLFFTLTSGCGNKFFDPTQVGRFRPVPAVNIILDSLGVAEEATVAWEQAEEPMPEDTVAVESDYVFMAGDVITVRITIRVIVAAVRGGIDDIAINLYLPRICRIEVITVLLIRYLASAHKERIKQYRVER